ncbi:hypothetical protein EXIGLDRAFT_671862 [Exidia glandulosa HHB12029]|uniref:N-acetyltransferase domain-containing protein n=1 Tax=Exidia glandulosa HHB12029 TaxID=1314781 RepID=A0A165K395_EXIGL|nr:hypothetical protein EXIGLDRAFT_671862 [Exidia glandulosa HHB12029]
MFHFELTRGTDIDPGLLEECAALFSDHYGIWGAKGPTPGGRVTMGVKTLKKYCLEDVHRCAVVTCRRGDVLVGHAFATCWNFEAAKSVCWVTQLVVHTEFRRQRVASFMLNMLKHDAFPDVVAFGLASSHPAACMTLATLSGIHLSRAHRDELDIGYIKRNASAIFSSSPVTYVKNATLHIEGDSCRAFTKFFVDHGEPNAVLSSLGAVQWPLGALPDGWEWVAVVPK